jgi:mannose/fructose-specific phosphotransferase system component IIA
VSGVNANVVCGVNANVCGVNANVVSSQADVDVVSGVNANVVLESMRMLCVE